MKPFKFLKTLEDNFYVYCYVREEESFMEKSWRGLDDSTVSSTIKHFELSEDSTDSSKESVGLENLEPAFRLVQETPFDKYSINNINREEVAIYLGLIWRLSENYTRMALPSYYRETSSIILGKNYSNVLWEYRVENKDCYKDLGFNIGRSWSNITNRVVNEAGIFEVNSFHEFILLQNSVQREASSNINLYCLNSPKRKEVLIEKLHANKAPNLINVLEENEIFINLAIGSDPGYCDVLLIKSKNDIEGQINKIVKEYTCSIMDYENSVDKIQTLDQFLTAMARIIGLPSKR